MNVRTNGINSFLFDMLRGTIHIAFAAIVTTVLVAVFGSSQPWTVWIVFAVVMTCSPWSPLQLFHIKVTVEKF